MLPNKSETYYLLPKDIVYFDVPENPHPLGHAISLFSGNLENHQVDIRIVSSNQKLYDSLVSNHHIYTNPFQLFIEVNINGSFSQDFYLKLDSKLREYLVLSLFLAHKEHGKFYYGQRSFTSLHDDSYSSLPYALIKFSLENSFFNSYYQSDYMKIKTNSFQHFTLIERSQMTDMASILARLLSSPAQALKQPIIDMFIHALTLPWNKPGTFYPSIVSIFSCFESILNKQQGQQIKDLMMTEFGHLTMPAEYQILTDLQLFRNGIAHLESHNILELGGGRYKCVKSSTGHVKAEFDIDKLDKARILLIDLILNKI